jgi:Coenzyme PQQ synthesis protein D (PqqD)
LDGVRATTDVVVSVAESFGVEAAEVQADVVAFLESLAASGLLEAS